MSEWIRFEDGKSRNALEFGTIMKDGRLIISNEIAQQSGLVPGAMIEVFYKPQDKVIGLKVVPLKTPYSYSVISTGPKDHPFDQPLAEGKGKPGAIIALRGFLNSRHIGLASKVRGHLYIDVESEMLIFEFPDSPKVIAPSSHAGEQMIKRAFNERVAGDMG